LIAIRVDLLHLEGGLLAKVLLCPDGLDVSLAERGTRVEELIGLGRLGRKELHPATSTPAVATVLSPLIPKAVVTPKRALSGRFIDANRTVAHVERATRGVHDAIEVIQARERFCLDLFTIDDEVTVAVATLDDEPPVPLV
jgi:hypothetical protein